MRVNAQPTVHAVADEHAAKQDLAGSRSQLVRKHAGAHTAAADKCRVRGTHSSALLGGSPLPVVETTITTTGAVRKPTFEWSFRGAIVAV